MFNNIKEILILNDSLIEQLKQINNEEVQDIRGDLIDTLRTLKQLYNIEKIKLGVSDKDIERILNKYLGSDNDDKSI